MGARAKIFMNGRSQAVRLPAEFRFDVSEVEVRRDPASGDVVLSSRPADWSGFLALVASLDIPSDFMAARDDGEPQRRDPLA